MKKLILFIFCLVSVASFAQSDKKTCSLIIDPDYKGSIAVYNKPNGKMIISIRQNYKEEDFLTFNISSQTTGFFYGTLEYSISGKKIKGWIKKAKYVGIYARNYSVTKLNLYLNPNLQAAVSSVIPDWTNQLYQVTSYNKSWVYVTIVYKGEIKNGWLSPDMQCSNPYTTCN